MEKKLEERFVVSNTKSKDEYIQKIFDFINKYPTIIPYETDKGDINNFKSVQSKFRNVSLMLLNWRCFSFKPLTSSYSWSRKYMVVYSTTLKCKLIVAFVSWNYGNSFLIAPKEVIGETAYNRMNNYFNISSAKRLYKLLVTEVIDMPNLIRNRKLLRDRIDQICETTFHYVPKDNRCFKLVKHSPNYNKDVILYHYQEMSLGNSGTTMKQSSYTYSSGKDFDEFVKIFDKEGSVHSNNFINDILPLINKKIDENITALQAKNSKVVSSFIKN